MMKKILILMCMLTVLFALSGCRVHKSFTEN